MKKIAVLVSGGGTNLQALIDYERSHADCPYKICVVISSTKNAYSLERAAKAEIPSVITSPFSVMGKEKAQSSTREEKNEAVSNAILEECKNRIKEKIIFKIKKSTGKDPLIIPAVIEL